MMQPALFPDDGSCGDASDVAVNGEQQQVVVDEKTIRSIDHSSSAVSVFLLSEPKGTSTADEKGSPEASEIWRRMKVLTAAKSGATSEYVTNKLCHCCRKAKPAGIEFHCGKHTYCSNHLQKRLNIPAVNLQRGANDLKHCPVCILACTCKTCNERLTAVAQIMKSECSRQSCGPREVKMGNLFDLCTVSPSNFASMSKSCSRSTLPKQAETTSATTNTSKSSTAAQQTSSNGSRSTDHRDKQWYEHLERLKPCIVGGKIDYSVLISDEKAKKRVSDFVYRQRKYFKMRQDNEDSPLTDERFKALSAINFPFEAQKSTRFEPSGYVILSLRDPSYRQTMEACFKKLGAKTNVIEDGKLTEKEAADDVYKKLSNKGGRFVKLMNPHDLNGGYTEVDDDEAWKKIRSDINRRMESAKRWLHPKKSGKDSTSVSKQPKKRKEDNTGDPKTKRPCKSKDRDKEENENPLQMKRATMSRGSVKGCPLEYVGNYIANHVEGWEVQRRTNRLGFDYFVVYKNNLCNKMIAVEGKDKFTGYDKLAIWAFRTGYYETHVVETEGGKEILERLGIEDDPYSIFNESSNETEQRTMRAQSEEPLQQQLQVSVGTNTRTSLDRVREEQQDNSAGSEVARAQDSGAGSNVNTVEANATDANPVEVEESPLAGFNSFFQTAKLIRSSLLSAEEKGDDLSVKFFGHLNGWIKQKSNDPKYVLRFRSKNIDETVRAFRSVVEQIDAEEGTNTFKNLAGVLIVQVQQMFPLSSSSSD